MQEFTALNSLASCCVNQDCKEFWGLWMAIQPAGFIQNAYYDELLLRRCRSGVALCDQLAWQHPLLRLLSPKSCIICIMVICVCKTMT